MLSNVPRGSCQAVDGGNSSSAPDDPKPSSSTMSALVETRSLSSNDSASHAAAGDLTEAGGADRRGFAQRARRLARGARHADGPASAAPPSHDRRRRIGEVIGGSPVGAHNRAEAGVDRPIPARYTRVGRRYAMAPPRRRCRPPAEPETNGGRRSPAPPVGLRPSVARCAEQQSRADTHPNDRGPKATRPCRLLANPVARPAGGLRATLLRVVGSHCRPHSCQGVTEPRAGPPVTLQEQVLPREAARRSAQVVIAVEHCIPMPPVATLRADTTGAVTTGAASGTI